MPLSLHEPVRVVAGDTVIWGRDLYLFPAAEWTLHYSLAPERGGTAILLDAAADAEVSTRHVVNVAAAVSALWSAGTYRIAGWVTNAAGQRFTLAECSSWIEVLPNPSLAAAGDTRTRAQKMVDSIEAGMSDLVSTRAVATTINGQTYTLRSLDELQRLLGYWRERREAELDAENPNRNTVRIIF